MPLQIRNPKSEIGWPHANADKERSFLLQVVKNPGTHSSLIKPLSLK
jgi:hypothetical protein